jgi:hypothetical protein
MLVFQIKFSPIFNHNGQWTRKINYIQNEPIIYAINLIEFKSLR